MPTALCYIPLLPLPNRVKVESAPALGQFVESKPTQKTNPPRFGQMLRLEAGLSILENIHGNDALKGIAYLGEIRDETRD
jgi:hypothetical protein